MCTPTEIPTLRIHPLQLQIRVHQRNFTQINGVFLFFIIFCHPHQSSDGGWNDNKWAPLEELLAIKGNREPQYATPVSPAKLKQITPTSIAYYAANEDNLFIIIILIHLFDHHWAPISMTYITSFPVCKHGRRWVSRQGQLQIVATEAATGARWQTALSGGTVRLLFASCSSEAGDCY